jgi:DNA-binding transcriptional LysR family regulator
MPQPRDTLTPDALAMLDAIDRYGSFSAAARALGQVPSALSYRVRQLEESLDVLLFDRSSRQAKLTPAGQALLIEARRILRELDAVSSRIRRLATGWESRLTLAYDTVICKEVLLDLCAQFDALSPPTQIRLQQETLHGTFNALVTGQADLAIGVSAESADLTRVSHRLLGQVEFAFAVAPHHPLAQVGSPLSDEQIKAHRAVAVADSAPFGLDVTVGLLPGQDVLTVSSMSDKIQAQLRGLGAGFLPLPRIRDHLASGALVLCHTQRPKRHVALHCAWATVAESQQGLALSWWRQQLLQDRTREALLGNPAQERTP